MTRLNTSLASHMFFTQLLGLIGMENYAKLPLDTKLLRIYQIGIGNWIPTKCLAAYLYWVNWRHVGICINLYRNVISS